MRIKCILTNSKDYKSFCGLENSIYTVKISKQYKYWYYDLCDMIAFYCDSSVELIFDVSDDEVKLARSLYGNHSYNESRLREYEPTVMVHTTTFEAYKEIIVDGSIKCWNLLKQQKESYEDKPIGNLIGDIEDFSNYVMLSPIDVNNEIIVASKQKGCIDISPNQKYQAGCRFYLDAKKLADDGLLLRDGQHIKVRKEIQLDKYLIWYSTAERIGLPVETTPKEFFEQSNRKFGEIYENIRYANFDDYELILRIDDSISKNRWKTWTDNKQAIFAFDDNEFLGWLQYNYFIEKWPFVNRLYVFEKFQNKGAGTALVKFWEREMISKGENRLMLSTESDNIGAQRLYNRLGYRCVGELNLREENTELIMLKDLL